MAAVYLAFNPAEATPMAKLLHASVTTQTSASIRTGFHLPLTASVTAPSLTWRDAKDVREEVERADVVIASASHKYGVGAKGSSPQEELAAIVARKPQSSVVVLRVCHEDFENSAVSRFLFKHPVVIEWVAMVLPSSVPGNVMDALLRTIPTTKAASHVPMADSKPSPLAPLSSTSSTPTPAAEFKATTPSSPAPLASRAVLSYGQLTD